MFEMIRTRTERTTTLGPSRPIGFFGAPSFVQMSKRTDPPATSKEIEDAGFGMLMGRTGRRLYLLRDKRLSYSASRELVESLGMALPLAQRVIPVLYYDQVLRERLAKVSFMPSFWLGNLGLPGKGYCNVNATRQLEWGRSVVDRNVYITGDDPPFSLQITPRSDMAFFNVSTVAHRSLEQRINRVIAIPKGDEMAYGSSDIANALRP